MQLLKATRAALAHWPFTSISSTLPPLSSEYTASLGLPTPPTPHGFVEGNLHLLALDPFASAERGSLSHHRVVTTALQAITRPAVVSALPSPLDKKTPIGSASVTGAVWDRERERLSGLDVDHLAQNGLLPTPWARWYQRRARLSHASFSELPLRGRPPPHARANQTCVVGPYVLVNQFTLNNRF